MVREVTFDRQLVLARGVVFMPYEKLDDVVDAWMYSSATLVDLIEVDEGLIESEAPGVDKLNYCCSKAVRVRDMLESSGWPDEFEVGCRRYERKLSWR